MFEVGSVQLSLHHVQSLPACLSVFEECLFTPVLFPARYPQKNPVWMSAKRDLSNCWSSKLHMNCR